VVEETCVDKSSASELSACSDAIGGLELGPPWPPTCTFYLAPDNPQEDAFVAKFKYVLFIPPVPHASFYLSLPVEM